jgi:hypothetical protein
MFVFLQICLKFSIWGLEPPRLGGSASPALHLMDTIAQMMHKICVYFAHILKK